MKIKPEHFATMQQKIEAFVAANRDKVLAHREGLKTDERVKDLDKRFRWDLSRAAVGARWICDEVYSYANDDHIDTALRRIVGGLAL